MNTPTPKHLDLKKDAALTITWSDGSTSIYPIDYLRANSPAADMRELRKEQARNPLTVLPASAAHEGPITATDAELVGNYAIRITFSDGHNTGIYSWQYLKEIDPQLDAPPPPESPNPSPPSSHTQSPPDDDPAAQYRV